MASAASPAKPPPVCCPVPKPLTRAHAAYVLGYNPYALRLQEEVCSDSGPAFWAWEESVPPLTLRQVSAAIRRLEAEIVPGVLPTLKIIVKDLAAAWQELLDCWYGGQDHREPFCRVYRREAPDQRERLCVMAQAALAPDHALHALVQFGAALAQYQWNEYVVVKDRCRCHDDTRSGEQQLPDLARLVRRAEALPPRLLGALPEVRRLTTFGPRLQDLGAVAFAERVLGPLPAGVRTFVPLLAFGDFLDVLSDKVQARLRDVPDEPAANKPQWDKVGQKLYYGGNLCAHYQRPAPNQTAILDAFEEQGWPSRIANPLVASWKLRDTIGDLQAKLKDSPLLVGRDGTSKGIIWRPRPGSEVP
jgi:hypothetical protein